MKKRVLFPLFFLLASTIVAQELPQASTFLPKLDFFSENTIEIMLPDSSHAYTFEIPGVDSMLLQRQFLNFNNHGQILSDSSIGWLDDTTGWYYFYKNLYDYDNMSRQVNMTEFEGNWLNNTWIPHYQYPVSYIGTSSLIEYELQYYYEYQIQTWRNDDSTYNHRNSLDQIDYAYNYNWLEDLEYYELQSYNHYAYNAEGLLTSDTSYTYWTPGVASISYLKVYEYNDQGQRTERRAYHWGGSNSWEEVEKHEYSFNINDDITSTFRYFWDENALDWYLAEKIYFSYYEDDVIYQIRAFELNEQSGLWEQDFTFEFFSSLHIVVHTDEAVSEESLLLYPNPSKGSIILEIPSADFIEIININGQILKQFRCSAGKNTIDLSDLDPGMYFVRSQKGKLHQRLIIQ